METINTRAIAGIKRFLERRDFEILEEDWAHGSDHIDFIAEEDNSLVFIAANVIENGGDGFGPESYDRESLERIAAAYLAEKQDYPECKIRFDIVSMLVLSDHKGFLKLHRNALADLVS